MFKAFKFLFFFFLALRSLPGVSSAADTTTIVDDIFNFDFRKADIKLLEIGKGDAFMAETMKLEVRWWEAVSSDDKALLKSFEEDIAQFDERFGDPVSDLIISTYKIRYYSAIHRYYNLPLLFFRVKHEINDLDITEYNSQGKDKYDLIKLYKSIFLLIEGSWLPFYKTPEYDQENQLKNIEYVISNGSSSNRSIGTYLLMKYYLEVEKNRSKAMPYLSELNSKYPNNKIFVQLLTNY